MVKLSNDKLTVTIDKQGAEITSVIDNQSGHEFIWQADPTYWNRHAPVLFPIVGNLKDGLYHYQGQTYQMGRHGFARDREFQVQKVTSNSATFNLKSDASTKAMYPFDVSFQVSYILNDNQITVTYEVLNRSKTEALYYSVGGHPAFNVTLDEKGEFDDVTIEILPHGHYRLFPLTDDGLILLNKARYYGLNNEPIKRNLFKDDALVFQVSRRNEIILHDNKTASRVCVEPHNMPFVGVWTPYPKQAPFICIEPWTGVADEADTDHDLTTKYSITKLPADQLNTHDFTMEFFKD